MCLLKHSMNNSMFSEIKYVSDALFSNLTSRELICATDPYSSQIRLRNMQEKPGDSCSEGDKHSWPGSVHPLANHKLACCFFNLSSAHTSQECWITSLRRWKTCIWTITEQFNLSFWRPWYFMSLVMKSVLNIDNQQHHPIVKLWCNKMTLLWVVSIHNES